MPDDPDDPNCIPPPPTGRPDPWSQARQLAADQTLASWVRQRRDQLLALVARDARMFDELCVALGLKPDDVRSAARDELARRHAEPPGAA